MWNKSPTKCNAHLGTSSFQTSPGIIVRIILEGDENLEQINVADTGG
nr:hypothetical protein [uncultured Anaerocolumna sp.]